LTAARGWDENTSNTHQENDHGTHKKRSVKDRAFGTAFISDQVRNFSFNLWGNFVYRLGVKLPGGS
jgi:hypothetical protein